MKGGTEMNNKMLYELCETLSREIEEVNNEVSKSGLTTAKLDQIDKLTHALKSIKTTLAMMESEYSYRGGYRADSQNGGYRDGGYQNGGVRYGYEQSYESRDRDSRGRYMRESDIVEHLKQLKGMTTDMNAREEIQSLIEKMR